MLTKLLVPYYFHPIAYVIEAEQILIRRPFDQVVILKNEIAEIRMVDRKEMKGTIRSFGVGGLYGYFGKFSNLKLGSMLWYATQRKNYSLIQTRNAKKYILTPDNPVDFLQQLKMQ